MIYSVILSTCGNPDHQQDPYRPLYGVPSERAYTASIEECQRKVKQYIETYNIGAGNWSGGQVYDGLGKIIGYIGYNGRYWERGEIII